MPELTPARSRTAEYLLFVLGLVRISSLVAQKTDFSVPIGLFHPRQVANHNILSLNFNFFVSIRNFFDNYKRNNAKNS